MSYLIKKLYCFFFLFLSAGLLAAENVPDTLHLTLPQAEEMLVHKSLQVIAAHYAIDIAHAQVLEARLWYNPYITYAQGLYDPSTKKYFDNGPDGQLDIQVSQLFSIAGRHSNTVKLAKLNEQLSELQFKDLTRSLKYELYNLYNEVAADVAKHRLYANETEQLKKFIEAAGQQVRLGVLPRNEVIRLTAEMQDIQNASLQNYAALNQDEKDLHILLNISRETFILTGPVPVDTVILPPLEQAITAAQRSRPDLAWSGLQVDYQDQNLRLQRSLAWPDLTLTAEHDQNSSYVRNYKGIGISFPLPVFNHNQAQIRAAKSLLMQSQTQDSLVQKQVENEVMAAYRQVIESSRQWSSLQPGYEGQLEELNRYAYENFSKRLISLIDFLDQVRTYTQSSINLIELKTGYRHSIDELNYVTGANLVK